MLRGALVNARTLLATPVKAVSTHVLSARSVKVLLCDSLPLVSQVFDSFV